MKLMILRIIHRMGPAEARRSRAAVVAVTRSVGIVPGRVYLETHEHIHSDSSQQQMFSFGDGLLSYVVVLVPVTLPAQKSRQPFDWAGFLPFWTELS